MLTLRPWRPISTQRTTSSASRPSLKPSSPPPSYYVASKQPVQREPVTVVNRRTSTDGLITLTLSSNRTVTFGTEANADFYTETLQQAASTRSTSRCGKEVADRLLDAWFPHASAGLVEQPNAIVVFYLGHMSASTTANDCIMDKVCWPSAVHGFHLDCHPQTEALCGWHALGNALDDIAARWPSTDESEFSPTKMCNELSVRDGLIHDISDDFMLWLLSKQGPFRDHPQTATIRDVATDPTGPLGYTEKQLDSMGPSCGITVVSPDAAQVVAFARRTARFSDESLARIINYQDELPDDVANFETLITEIAVEETDMFVRNIFDLWPVVRRNCCGSDANDHYTFLRARKDPDLAAVPPGVLLYDAEAMLYPNLSCLAGRSASFVVNTIFPALCLTADTAGCVPSIEITVKPDGYLSVNEHPSWMRYGHWICVTLDVLQDSSWKWTVKDSLNPTAAAANDCCRYAHLLRELTVFLLGVFRVRGEWARRHFAGNLL